MTKEEYYFLKKYEINLTTARYSDYSRNMSRSVLERMKEVYDRNRHTNIALNSTCGACQLRFLKQVATLYFEEKMAREGGGKDDE